MLCQWKLLAKKHLHDLCFKFGSWKVWRPNQSRSSAVLPSNFPARSVSRAGRTAEPFQIKIAVLNLFRRRTFHSDWLLKNTASESGQAIASRGGWWCGKCLVFWINTMKRGKHADHKTKIYILTKKQRSDNKGDCSVCVMLSQSKLYRRDWASINFISDRNILALGPPCSRKFYHRRKRGVTKESVLGIEVDSWKPLSLS